MIETILKLKNQRAKAAEQSGTCAEVVEHPEAMQTDLQTDPKIETRIMRRTAVRKEAKKQVEPEPKKMKGNRFTLVEYSDKSLALFGDTKQIKEQLKAIGGRYNPNLRPFGNDTKAPGWIFSKNKRAEIEKIIN